MFFFPFSLLMKGLINGTLIPLYRIDSKRDKSCSRCLFGVHTLSVPASALARAGGPPSLPLRVPPAYPGQHS